MSEGDNNSDHKWSGREITLMFVVFMVMLLALSAGSCANEERIKNLELRLESLERQSRTTRS